VLHVVENLDRGAVENWLVRSLRHARRIGLASDWTFYCTLGRAGRLDEEAKALGARVIYTPVPIGQKAAFVKALREELRRGRYDVLHCHHDLVSAVYLVAALGLPVRKRLVHVHNADETVLTQNRIKQLVFKRLLRGTCLILADSIVGISNHTLDTFLNGRARRQGRDVVHYYGIDAAPFAAAKLDPQAFRRSLGFADDARILLFAGRIVPEKNPVFAVEVLNEMRRSDPSAVGVFVGSGSMEAAVLRRIEELGLSAACRQLGWRSDLADIMCCCDWFILPRPEAPMEGFGLAVVEAQLAGLRMLLSAGIADDPLLSTASFRRLPLAAGPKAWAQAAMDLMRAPAPPRAAALAALRASPMDMDSAVTELTGLAA
jgi:glycosyltransferase involved in cell wall biosynthesis